MSYITVIFAMSADVLEPDMTRKTVMGTSNATAEERPSPFFQKQQSVICSVSQYQG